MNLLIVESPSKAKTIEKYLGAGWRVIASVGHVRDLVPENGSVDTEHDFAMRWQIMPGKEKQIKQIINELKKADAVYLASDPDREGEAIAWHILDILKAKHALDGKKVYRVAFHEITKHAVMDAIQHPREIDTDLVDAYLVRRALDYLIGFGISPLLWRRNLGRSAGRVQSVAVKLVVDREREIENFKPVEYWSVTANCNHNGTDFNAQLSNFNGKKIEKMTIENNAYVHEILEKIGKPVIGANVISIDKKKISRRAAAPFTTSTLQQEAARKLYFSSRRTMSTAQKLYEQGLITYMRTDATNLAADAVSEIRAFIAKNYGDGFVPQKPNVYVTKSKNAQEAHEAIRPTHFDGEKPTLSGDEAKLYDLIWKRTIACQMTNAEFDSVAADIETDNHAGVFHAVGTTRVFDGFMRVYTEDKDDATDSNDTTLPSLSVGDKITITELLPEQHFTQPPARYTEASLVKKLEELGIGRPSTYAPTIQTIQQREYVTKSDKQGTERLYNEIKLKNEKISEKENKEITGADRNKLIPTDIGIVVTDFLQESFPDILDYNFTATVEKDFDNIAEGLTVWTNSIDTFYKIFHPIVQEVSSARSERKVGERILGIDPATNRQVSVKIGRFGPFVQIGQSSDEEKPIFASLLKHQSIETITLEEALELFKLPKNLGEYKGDVVSVGNGRFGPFVKIGKTYASLPKECNLMEVTLEQAIDLVEEKLRKSKEKIIKTLGEEDPIEILRGRFGPYIVFKGKNYKIPKEMNPEELTQEVCEKIIATASDKTKTTKKGKAK